MPKELLIESAMQLRDVTDKLESYASEMEGGEDEHMADDIETESDASMPNTSYGNGGGGKSAKIKMAAAAIRKGLKKY